MSAGEAMHVASREHQSEGVAGTRNANKTPLVNILVRLKMSWWQWILLVWFGIGIAYELIKRVRIERQHWVEHRRTDREALDPLAPRPSSGTSSTRTQNASSPPTAVPQGAEPQGRAGLSLGTKVTLTIFYLPGLAMLWFVWHLARPAVVQGVTASIGNSKITAVVIAAIAVAIFALLLLPFYLIWRRPR